MTLLEGNNSTLDRDVGNHRIAFEAKSEGEKPAWAIMLGDSGLEPPRKGVAGGLRRGRLGLTA